MIYIVYAMYIPEICIVDINCIYNKYSWYKPGISEPGIYMAYLSNMPSSPICPVYVIYHMYIIIKRYGTNP